MRLWAPGGPALASRPARAGPESPFRQIPFTGEAPALPLERPLYSPRGAWHGTVSLSISVLSVVFCAGFLLLSGRWLLALRRESLRTDLPLTSLDKLLAAAPVAYTLLCIVAGVALVERAFTVQEFGGATSLPLLGVVDARTALFTLWLLAGLAAASPLIVISTVETYFARKLPELVHLGRQAVFQTLTGVRVPPPKDEDKWQRLLQK